MVDGFVVVAKYLSHPHGADHVVDELHLVNDRVLTWLHFIASAHADVVVLEFTPSKTEWSVVENRKLRSSQRLLCY